MTEPTKVICSRIISGFDCDDMEDGHCIISKNGKQISNQPSIAAARLWVMEERRKAAAG